MNESSVDKLKGTLHSQFTSNKDINIGGDDNVIDKYDCLT